MIKYSNPFFNIQEVVSIFKSLDVSPTKCQFADRKSGGSQVVWQEEILSVVSDRVYENETHYFTTRIHMTNDGFDALMSLIDPERRPTAIIAPHTNTYDEHYAQIGSLLRVFKLVEKEAGTCDSGTQS